MSTSQHIRKAGSATVTGIVGLVIGGWLLGHSADEVATRAYFFVGGIWFACWQLASERS